MQFILKTIDLSVMKNNKVILTGINITIPKNKITAIMGPNGSGKTTLARAIMGDPSLKKQGKIIFNGEDITDLSPDEISKKGVYLAFQHPPEIDVLKTRVLLKYILNNFDEEKLLNLAIKYGLPEDFLDRGINEGFSGGERKKMELLFIDLLDPKLIILDEIDSGLDIDSLRLINNLIVEKIKEGKTFMIVTHYTRIFQSITPDKVYILKNGKIVWEGASSILGEIEKYGYAKF
ncbi:MAG TPA: Fe-S cluster assembly ATPase SufC [Candidatus Nanopusillus sp.]|nr:Fe-S cluster assembly ATPase SufC [Candidatus Nanopusillus sp.]